MELRRGEIVEEQVLLGVLCSYFVLLWLSVFSGSAVVTGNVTRISNKVLTFAKEPPWQCCKADSAVVNLAASLSYLGKVLIITNQHNTKFMAGSILVQFMAGSVVLYIQLLFQ